jgi:hypothetical protein
LQYFYKLTEGVVTIAAMTALMEHQDLFNGHTDASPKVKGLLIRDEYHANPAAAPLTSLGKMALTIMQLVDGVQIGEVSVIRIEPGGRLEQEALTAHNSQFSRFHLVLHGLPGITMAVGDEAVSIKTGEAWWADAKQPCSTTNKSTDDLFVMQMDIRVK